ncbi:hypothetical protein SPONN_871 [uncultured Candidatus Thioglobus sp.]|nr:hypothetical protein SPONN_871 [uncultured Candidatus Thioglobus sp.]
MRKCAIIIATVLILGIIGGVAVYYRYYSDDGYLGFTGSAAVYYRHYDDDGFSDLLTRHLKKNLTKKLTLNETQKVELNQLTESLATTFKAGKKSFRALRTTGLNDILSLLEANKLDQEEALKMVQAHLATIESHAKEMISSAADFTDSLTAEQREKLKKIIERRVSKRRNHD